MQYACWSRMSRCICTLNTFLDRCMQVKPLNKLSKTMVSFMMWCSHVMYAAWDVSLAVTMTPMLTPVHIPGDVTWFLHPVQRPMHIAFKAWCCALDILMVFRWQHSWGNQRGHCEGDCWSRQGFTAPCTWNCCGTQPAWCLILLLKAMSVPVSSLWFYAAVPNALIVWAGFNCASSISVCCMLQGLNFWSTWTTAKCSNGSASNEHMNKHLTVSYYAYELQHRTVTQ